MDFVSTHTIDVAVMVFYLVGSFAIGIFASRLLGAPASEEGFYLAGRRMPGWVNGISYAVTAMNADVAPLYCGLTVVIGLPIAWYYLSRFALAWLLIALLFAVRWRKLEIRTGPEFYSLRFGGKGAKIVRVVSALFAVSINMIPWLGAGLLGMHKIMGPIFGYESKAVTLVTVVPVLLTYVWISGFAGVVVTDILQSAVIILANLLLFISVMSQFGGPSGMQAAIASAYPEEHGEILSVLPVAGHEVLGPLVVVAWAIVATIGRGGSVDLDGQRMFSARSAREAAKVPIWAAITLFGMLLLLTLPVMSIIATQPEMYHALPAVREQTYGMLLREHLPVGVLGIAMAALLASVMSTIDSHLNYGAQTMMNDVLRQLFPRTKMFSPESPAVLWVGRLIMVGILACGIGVMYSTDSLFRIAAVISGMFASSAAFYWAQWWWWRINFASWLAAMIAGPVVYLSLGWVLPHWPWWQSQLELTPAAADTMAMLQALISIAVTSAIWVSAAVVFPPESDSTLCDFYRRARPLGAWKPIERIVLKESHEAIAESPSGLLAGGVFTALVGSTGIVLGVLCLSQFAIGRYQVGSWLFLGSVVGIIMFSRLFRWHMLRMEMAYHGE